MKRNFAYRRWYVLKKNVKKKKFNFLEGAKFEKMLMTPFRVHKRKKEKNLRFFFFGSICLVSFKTRVRQSIDVAQKQILQKKKI